MTIIRTGFRRCSLQQRHCVSFTILLKTIVYFVFCWSTVGAPTTLRVKTVSSFALASFVVLRNGLLSYGLYVRSIVEVVYFT